MKKTISLILAFTAIYLQAQFTNVLITSNYDPNEPSIAIDPNNTNRLVAACNINSYFFSEDGGNTWTSGLLSSSYGVWGDPCMMVDNAGDYYFFHLSYPSSGGSFIDRIVCQKYSSGSWNNGTYFGLNPPKDQDKEWVYYDRATEKIYACWTEFDAYGSTNSNNKSRILFVQSSDHGATWSAPVKVNDVDGDCVDSDNTVEGAVPAVGPSGEIYTAWSGPAGIQFSRSTDGGLTWSDNVLVDTQPGGWDFAIPGIYRANGMPITLCDLSDSPYHGTIYVSWGDQRNGANDTDIWLRKSTDGGQTWSEPVRVNNDDGTAQQFLHWMTIDQTTGILYAVFYDRRDHNNNLTDVYLARSTDGGETFQNYKISETPFLPNSSVFFGDYTNITAHDGVIRPIWMSLNSGNLKLWTAIINEDMFTDTDDYEYHNYVDLHQTYPNPASDLAFISFKLRKAQNISLVLYDTQGNKVADLIDDEYYTLGKHIFKVDLNALRLSPGLYHYQLLSESGSKSGKLMVE